MSLPDLVLALCATPALAAAVYLMGLALLARRWPTRVSSEPRVSFEIVVPAHNEEDGIGDTVASLLGVRYPRDRFGVLVVADNCSDRTAERAAASGARVLQRNDRARPGKGYALATAFQRVLDEGLRDAVVVVDADTVVSENLLEAFGSRIAGGAHALQAHYGVRNPDASWRTQLMTIALAAFHGVRSRGRERLGLSCGLRGNGMAFTAELLRTHPPGAFSIVEDLEYGIQLGCAGVRVAYLDDAAVLGSMASTASPSRSQRRRWERGRAAIARQHAMPLLKAAWRSRDIRLLDLALDLLVPPLAQLVAVIAVGLAVSIAARSLGVHVAPWLWAAALSALAVHVTIAWVVSGTGLRGLASVIVGAPAYVVWKIGLRVADRGRKPQEWIRTTREVQP